VGYRHLMKRWPVKVTRSCCGALEFRSDDLPVRGTGKAPRVVDSPSQLSGIVYTPTLSDESRMPNLDGG
jgi:hypothetical protein